MKAETAAWRKLELDVRQALAGRTATQGRDALRDVDVANGHCLRIVEVNDGAAPALVVYDTRLYGPGIVAFFDGVAWRAHAFLLPDGSAGKEAFRWREVRVLRDGTNFLLLATRVADPVCRYGCGCFGPGCSIGSIGLYRLAEPPSLVWRSNGGSNYGSLILSNDLVLETFLDPNPDPVHIAFSSWPFVAHGLALPAGVFGPLGQILWERRGDELVIRARRLQPSPSRAVDVFIGALLKHDRATALLFATEPGLYDSWKGAPADLEPIEAPAEAARVEAEEATYWDALPTEARGPAPSGSRLVYKFGKYDLVLTRSGGEWKVTTLELSAR